MKANVFISNAAIIIKALIIKHLIYLVICLFTDVISSALLVT